MRRHRTVPANENIFLIFLYLMANFCILIFRSQRTKENITKTIKFSMKFKYACTAYSLLLNDWTHVLSIHEKQKYSTFSHFYILSLGFVAKWMIFLIFRMEIKVNIRLFACYFSKFTCSVNLKPRQKTHKSVFINIDFILKWNVFPHRIYIKKKQSFCWANKSSSSFVALEWFKVCKMRSYRRSLNEMLNKANTGCFIATMKFCLN